MIRYLLEKSNQKNTFLYMHVEQIKIDLNKELNNFYFITNFTYDELLRVHTVSLEKFKALYSLKSFEKKIDEYSEVLVEIVKEAINDRKSLLNL